MANTIHVRDIQRRVSGDYAEISARVDGLPAGPDNDRLRFRFPAAFDSWLSGGSESMVAALLPIAMLLDRLLHVEGHVSPLFHSGCQQIIRLYHAWDRRLRPIQLDVAISEADDRTGGKANACFFSGGVDSFYTLLKNLDREHGDSRITHLIFIRGYADCPLGQDQPFGNMRARLLKIASALGLQLVLAETNLKAFTPPPAAEWDWNAGSQLASAGLCLAPGLRRLFIPSGDTYSTLSPWGSHPLADPLWSTESLEFRHDGCEAFRSQKMEWYVAKSRLAIENLRVCGYDTTGLRNCGRCEKCLRTMIALAALGVDVPAGLFAAPLDADRIRKLDGGHRVAGFYLRDNLKLLDASGRAPELQAAVRHALRSSVGRWLVRGFQTGAREIDRTLLRGRLRSWAITRARHDAGRQADLRRSPARWVLRQAWRSATTDRSDQSK